MYIIRLAAEFILAEASKASLITVTDCRIADNMRDMTILLSVLPESEEQHALNFLKRKRSQFREYPTRDHFSVAKKCISRGK
ncbi:MAG: hypothetical protein H8D63_03180, partial [Parcubacteria group bacterium]|nr:hypothetical protein [Parcubacteria group bacterium]